MKIKLQGERKKEEEQMLIEPTFKMEKIQLCNKKLTHSPLILWNALSMYNCLQVMPRVFSQGMLQHHQQQHQQQQHQQQWL